MQLYKTTKGNLLKIEGRYYKIEGNWDDLVNKKNLHQQLLELSKRSTVVADGDLIIKTELLPPIGNQEVWASGVTYLRSRDARMEESKDSGGADFYSKVYEADRPELFFKAMPHRVLGPGQKVRIRKDSTWNVPEPELTLFINSDGNIEAYTAGNDMSSRSIEGENPLYLPQAKMYEGSCALGPCLYVPSQPIPTSTEISITIARDGKNVFDAKIQLNRMKRQLPELAGWLYKEMTFKHGCLLMTGTGLVPGNDFTLASGDIVNITIEGIGTLSNPVA